VHLVVDQVVELEHVHVADGHLPLETFARATVEELRLTRQRQIGEFRANA
jgi:hypothetical protein